MFLFLGIVVFDNVNGIWDIESQLKNKNECFNLG